MGKITNFSGQPIFSQIINLISKSQVQEVANLWDTDRYYKKFKTYDHLIAMLYCIINGCTSIREVVTGILACEQRLNHLGLKYFPRRSTLSEANLKRNSRVFEEIYKSLYELYGKSLPDSQSDKLMSNLYICDSTTIALFQEILKNSGRSPVNGRRKGGIKTHTLIKADQDVPCLVHFSAGAAHDSPFLKAIKIPAGSIIVFDRGYNNYEIFSQWSEQNISFVTRLRKGTVYETINKNLIEKEELERGVLSDTSVIIGHNHHTKIVKTKARLITFYDKETDSEFVFMTNNFVFSPSTIAEIYKKRWQIESLFKRIKQNYPLQYFLGDNENAIKIQIWCALIVDLLLKYISKQVKRKWSFSNLASIIRLHSMSYINLFKFLENPEKSLVESKLKKAINLPLFPT